MNILNKLLLIFFTILIFAACTTNEMTPRERGITNIDDLISAIADNAVQYLPAGETSNLAVYYFTVDGRDSSISDYLINGLTTEMANKVPAGYKVVSRKGLDRIMEEYSFQLTDLVSEETQVDIGELLGADTIITGFITSLPDRDNINIQIMDVYTGAVTGGFSLDYHLTGEFSREYSSETITVERKYEETDGIATETTIFENFNNIISEITPAHYEEHWGDRIVSASAETGIDREGFAYIDISAEFDSTDILEDWNDSDLNFYMDLPLNQKIEDRDGVYIKLRPEGFSRVFIFVRQEEQGEIALFGSSVNLKPDIWNEMNIPFENLNHIDGKHSLELDKDISILLGIPYLENVKLFYFTDDEKLNRRLSVDEVGLYRLKTEESPDILSSFEDEINRVLVSYYVDGSSTYMDYITDDSGILKNNDGIISQKINLDIADEGPVGRFLNFSGEFAVTDKIEDYLNTQDGLLLVLDLTTAVELKDSDKLSFIINSDTVSHGYISIHDSRKGYSYESVYNISKNWSRVSFNLNEIKGDSKENPTLASNPVLFRFLWNIPENKIRESIETGILTFNISLDELLLQ